MTLSPKLGLSGGLVSGLSMIPWLREQVRGWDECWVSLKTQDALFVSPYRTLYLVTLTGQYLQWWKDVYTKNDRVSGRRAGSGGLGKILKFTWRIDVRE